MSIEGEVREVQKQLRSILAMSKSYDLIFPHKDAIEKAINLLKLTNRPLSEKEVEKVLLDEFDKRGQYFKAEINNVAKLICSHFSKQIKYPEKNDLANAEIELEHDSPELNQMIGWNKCYETMRKLNGEGGV